MIKNSRNSQPGSARFSLVAMINLNLGGYEMYRKSNSLNFVIVLILVLFVVAGSMLGESVNRGKVGQVPEYPVEYPFAQDVSLVLAKEPTITLNDSLIATVSFETAMDCPAARVYYGIYEPNQKLPLPRYRHISKEELEGFSTHHRVKIDINKMMRSRVDVLGLKEKGGGVVAYRLEIYNPKDATACFYDRRFAFQDSAIVPAIIQGPFVDQITETGVIISWDTDLPVRGEVHVDNRIFSPEDNEAATHFEVRVSELQPGGVYPYHVRIRKDAFESGSQKFSFRTLERDASAYSFAVMGDCRIGIGGGERAMGGVNYKVLSRFLIDAFHRNVDCIFITGDIVDGYTTSALDFRMQLRTYKYAIEPVSHYLPIYEVMGNHDVVIDQYDDGSKWGIRFDKRGANSSEQIFADAFVNPTNGPEPEVSGAPTYLENVYYIDYGNSRFVVMNNNYWWADRPEEYGGNLEGYVLDDQMAWLRKVFAEAASKPSIRHLFLFAQEPMFPGSGHTKDAMWYHGGIPEKNYGVDRTYVVERRDEIWQIFVETGKAVAGFFGDEHGYCRTLITPEINPQFAHPVWHIVSAGAGAPYYSQDKDVPWASEVRAFSTQLNYALVKVDGKRVAIEVYSFTGELIDGAVLVE